MDDKYFIRDTVETSTEEINPLVKIRHASLSGRSKRKLERTNTVHLKGICPKCGAFGMRFHKDIFNGVANKPDHNKWVCKKCGYKATRDQLKYVKYD